MNIQAAALTLTIIATSMETFAGANFYPPGHFAIDGVPVNCRMYPTIVTTSIPDSAMFNGQAILLNPAVIGGLPTPLKLYVYAHECAHGMGYINESQADCVAIKTGRNQGWFPPQAFNDLIVMFQNNPGSLRHPPGPVRVQNMYQCYQDTSS
ncbi:hypothetical protein [Pseudomonas sp. MIACH]|uniref:hypothetical protein n=1 Tax=Pseudomonas sp. MIACH TaxID=1078355 RepID=UPI0012E25101|nr:hypothetical protein [Pseudomonas sp. MIACH]